MINILEYIADYTGIAFGSVLAIILVAAVIRVIVKHRRGEEIETTPVGVMNDLPDSVTGMNKYSDALNTDDGSNRKE